MSGSLLQQLSSLFPKFSFFFFSFLYVFFSDFNCLLLTMMNFDFLGPYSRVRIFYMMHQVACYHVPFVYTHEQLLILQNMGLVPDINCTTAISMLRTRRTSFGSHLR